MLKGTHEFSPSISPRKEMGDHMRKRKNLQPRLESNPRPRDLIVPYSTASRLSYEARREQVVGDYGGNCGKYVNV